MRQQSAPFVIEFPTNIGPERWSVVAVTDDHPEGAGVCESCGESDARGYVSPDAEMVFECSGCFTDQIASGLYKIIGGE